MEYVALAGSDFFLTEHGSFDSGLRKPQRTVLSLDATGQRLWCTEKSQIVIRNTTDFKESLPRFTNPNLSGGGTDLTCLKAGRRWVAVGSLNSRVHLLRQADGGLEASWPCKTTALDTLFNENFYPVRSIDLAANETLAAAGMEDGHVRIFRVPKGEVVAHTKAHPDQVSAVAFAPGGDYLATGSYDRTVKLWRLTAGGLDLEQVQEFPVSGTGRVRQLAFSPDGHQLLVLAEKDCAVRIWNLEHYRRQLRDWRLDW